MFWSVVAGVSAPAGLFVMLRQLDIARNSFGGKGVELAAHETPGTRGLFSVDVSLVGPGVRYSVEVSLLGAEASNRPPVRPSMDCHSEAISWRFTLDKGDPENMFCLFTWVDAVGEGVRTGAVCAPFIGDELFEWKWFRFYDFRRWLQRQTKIVAPLGKWVQIPNGLLLDGQGPHDYIPELEPIRQRTKRPRWLPPQLPS